MVLTENSNRRLKLFVTTGESVGQLRQKRQETTERQVEGYELLVFERVVDVSVRLSIGRCDTPN
ncbi:hypothetical protein HSBGL_2980 [Halapricum desulfuricans]|uniref:Uncharacterized protein n=1 Tax=Halapricum desulfuricans TaxID=2841257 RepID=A0A897NLQ3_9EURY|nr:hypothetical protein HSBGL_2980 [Halapricum desulfuricans]